MRRTAVVWLLASVVSCGTPDENNPIVIVENNATTNNGVNNTSPNNLPANNTSSNNLPANNLPGGDGARFSLLDVALDTPTVAYTPDGVGHMVYTAGADPGRLMYGTCTQDCGMSDSWTLLELATEFTVPDSRFAADAQGGLHIVYQLGPFGASEQTYYATCTRACATAANWSVVDLTPALDGTGFVYRGSPLVVAPDGAVYLITGDFTTNGRIMLTQCAGDCHDGANWSSGAIRNGGHRSALAVSGNQLHHVMASPEGPLVYRTCSSNCTTTASWQESAGLFAYDTNGAVTLAAVGSELRLAYNQGFSTDPTVQQQNTRLLYWTCSSGCLDAANWTGTVLAGPKDGDHLDMAAVGSATVLGFDSDALEMVLGVCEGSCESADSWQYVAVDSSEQMAADHDPYDFLCGGSRPHFAAWFPEQPSIAISPTTGSGLVMYTGSLLQQCSVGGMSVSTNLMGRVVFLP